MQCEIHQSTEESVQCDRDKKMFQVLQNYAKINSLSIIELMTRKRPIHRGIGTRTQNINNVLSIKINRKL